MQELTMLANSVAMLSAEIKKLKEERDFLEAEMLGIANALVEKGVVGRDDLRRHTSEAIDYIVAEKLKQQTSPCRRDLEAARQRIAGRP